MERDQYTDLEQLPNVGPAIAGNLRRIGIAVPDDLVGRDPYDMYDDLCQVTGTRHDPCVLDVFIAAVRFMAGEPATPWWAYTAERKAAFVSRNPQGRKAKGTDMPSIAYVQSALQHHYQNASRLDARINLHAKYSTNQQGFHAWAFECLRLPSTCRVLEVGCGSGRLWLENQHRLPAGWDLTLSDLSAGMLGEAQQHLSDCGHPLQFIASDAQALPFADHCFEAIIANHMLYHVPNRAAAYREFRRVLKPSGRLYAATISRSNMQELDELVKVFRPSHSQDHETGSLISDRRLSTGFNLEHGASELARWFSSVTLHHYDDALVVPEAEPLVEYVRSTGYLQEDALAKFQRHVEAVIERHGPIRISKEVGMFEASQPSASYGEA